MAGGVLWVCGVLAFAMGVQGCAEADADHSAGTPTGGEGDVTVSLDFMPSLTIANETLVFPLSREPAHRSLAANATGDLVVAYTRVGCWVDPEMHIGGTYNPVAVAADAAELTTVTISQSLTETIPAPEPARVAMETCVSLRPPGGTWQPFIQPTKVTTTASAVELEFSIPATVADAGAIFLPTYTSIAKVTYTVRPL